VVRRSDATYAARARLPLLLAIKGLPKSGARRLHLQRTTRTARVETGAHEINNPSSFIRMNIGLLQSIWDDSIHILDRESKKEVPRRETWKSAFLTLLPDAS